MTAQPFPPCPFDAAIRAGGPLPSLSIRHQVPPRGHSFLHDGYRKALASGVIAHADAIAYATRHAAAAMIRDAELRAEIAERLKAQAYDALAQLQNETRGAHANAQAIAAIVSELDGTEWGPDTIDAVASILRSAGFAIRDVDDDGCENSPPCGHSACRQHWIDTGSAECVDAEP